MSIEELESHLQLDYDSLPVDVQKQLGHFSDLLQQNAICLAGALMSEGETVLTVKFDNIFKRTDSDERIKLMIEPNDSKKPTASPPGSPIKPIPTTPTAEIPFKSDFDPRTPTKRVAFDFNPNKPAVISKSVDLDKTSDSIKPDPSASKETVVLRPRAASVDIDPAQLIGSSPGEVLARPNVLAKVKRRKKKAEMEREKRTMSISVAAYHNTDNIGLRSKKKMEKFHSNRYEKVMINHMLEGISSSTDNLEPLVEDFKSLKARKRIKVECGPDTSTNSSENTSESQTEYSDSSTTSEFYQTSSLSADCISAHSNSLASDALLDFDADLLNGSIVGSTSSPSLTDFTSPTALKLANLLTITEKQIDTINADQIQSPSPDSLSTLLPNPSPGRIQTTNKDGNVEIQLNSNTNLCNIPPIQTNTDGKSLLPSVICPAPIPEIISNVNTDKSNELLAQNLLENVETILPVLLTLPKEIRLSLSSRFNQISLELSKHV